MTGEEIVVRYCSLENMDNQCGDFKYMDEPFKGCILTCTYDGCNTATTATRGATFNTLCSVAINLLLALTFASRG